MAETEQQPKAAYNTLEGAVRPLVRPHLHAIRPYVPGRPIADVQREFGFASVIKLASNENPLGPSPRAREAARAVLDEAHRYPDGAAQDLRAALSRRYGLPEDHFVASNGSDEMIKMLSETFLDPGDEVVMPFPSFVQYAFGAQVMNAHLVRVPLREDFTYDFDRILAAVNERTKLVYLCSPNNPTGTWFTHAQARDFLDRLPDRAIIVLDEAYVEYVDAPDPLRALEFIRAGRPVLSLRTFSKIYGLAGLRIGYAVGAPDAVRYIHQVREPFNANAVAQAAAAAALFDEDHVRRSRAANRAGREQFGAGLRALGIPFIETQGNFVLAKVGDGQAAFEALLRRGVIVRAGFAGLDEYVRISIGLPEENEVCLAGLAEFMRSRGQSARTARLICDGT